MGGFPPSSRSSSGFVAADRAGDSLLFAQIRSRLESVILKWGSLLSAFSNIGTTSVEHVWKGEIIYRMVLRSWIRKGLLLLISSSAFVATHASRKQCSNFVIVITALLD